MPNRVLEMSFSYLQNVSFYYLSGKYTFLCNFLRSLAGNICLHVSSGTNFCTFKSSVLVLCRNSVFFSFCLVNSKCGAYQAAEHDFVHSYPKMFLLFFSLILGLVSGLKSSF